MAHSGDESSKRIKPKSSGKKKKLERASSVKVMSSTGSVKGRSSSKVRSGSKTRSVRSSSSKRPTRSKSGDPGSVRSKIKKEKSRRKVGKNSDDASSSRRSRRRSLKHQAGHESSDDDESCIILPDFDDMSLDEPVEPRGRSSDRSNQDNVMVVSRTPSVSGARRERLTVTRSASGTPTKPLTSPGGSSSSGRRSSLNDASNMLLKMQQSYSLNRDSDSDEASTGLNDLDDVISVGSKKKKKPLLSSPNPFAPNSGRPTAPQSQRPEVPDGSPDTTNKNAKSHNPFCNTDNISVPPPVEGNPFMKEEQKGYVAPTQSQKNANKKDEAMDVDLSLNERLAAGEQLTREKALELTVGKMKHRLEENEIERCENEIRIQELEETVKSQASKIRALEYYFRKMHETGSKDDAASIAKLDALIAEEKASAATATTNGGGGYFSFGFGGGSNNKNKTQQPVVAPPSSPGQDMLRNIYSTGADKDFEIEAEAPSRLSMSFQKAGAKVRRAKAEAIGDDYIA